MMKGEWRPSGTPLLCTIGNLMIGRASIAEGFGTALLVAAVVGSGIMGERLAGGNAAIALLANAFATGAALVALILTFGPISGAHFNPVVTGVGALDKRIGWSAASAFVAMQIIGGILGVLTAHLMFGLPLVMLSSHARSGGAQVFSEFVATFGLVSVVVGCARHRVAAAPFAVAAYICAAYWFTASTSFANPAVTIARALTNTFAGIRPGDVPAFIAAQVLGALAARIVMRWLSEAGDLSTGQAAGAPVKR